MRMHPLFLITLFTAASAPLLAVAQTADKSQYLGQIVVFGTSGNGAVFGNAGAETLDAEDIAKRQATSVLDALRGNPSVIASQRGNPLRALPNIRGFGGSPHMANDPSSKMTLDGISTDGNRVYQNSGAMPVDPAILRSVQVLTGPLASLEYGSGVAGGTVAMETINGSDLTEGKDGLRLRQQIGANSNGKGWQTSSTLGWQASDRVDFLFNYTRRGADEQKDGAGELLKLPGYNLPSYLMKARYKIDDANTLTFSATKTETAERDVPYGQATGAAAFGNVNRDISGQMLSLAWNYNPAGNDLIDLELKASRSDQDITITPIGRGASATFAGRYEAQTDRLSLKNTAHFETGGISHVLRSGVEWSTMKRDTWSSPANQPGYGYNPAGKDQRLAVFAVNNTDFGNELGASLGLRVERQKVEGTKNGGALSYGPFSNTAKTLGFGVEKGLGQGVSVFGSATYGESLASLDVFHFQSPSRNGKYYGDGVQRSRNYEVGVKYEGVDVFGSGDRVTASLSGYQTDVRNALFGPATGGRAEYPAFNMRGIEMAAHYQHQNGFYLQAAISHADHHEKHTATGDVWRDYTYNPGTQGSITIGKSWDNGWDLAWTTAAAKSVSIDQITSSSRHAGWGVSDLSATYRPQSGALAGSEIHFAVENIFDKTYKQPMAYLNEPGRNLKLTLAKTF